jgi:hypothetical protein
MWDLWHYGISKNNYRIRPLYRLSLDKRGSDLRTKDERVGLARARAAVVMSALEDIARMKYSNNDINFESLARIDSDKMFDICYNELMSKLYENGGSRTLDGSYSREILFSTIANRIYQINKSERQRQSTNNNSID